MLDTVMATISYDELLTPNDIKAFYRLAAPNLRSGCWGSVRRHCSGACDCLEVHLPCKDDPILAFERDRCGIYHLWWHLEERERQQLKSGDAHQCLMAMAEIVGGVSRGDGAF
jgi:hypothetical protein